MQNSEQIWRLVDAKQDAFNALSDRVWGTPELCYGEFKSCAEHTAMLKDQGFRVTENVAGIPTAVMGEAGEDGPVIAILGEYDALPGLSQEAGVAEQRPLPGPGYGHGCGHNLLGSASLLAATAGFPAKANPLYPGTTLKPTAEEYVTSYNNFYEFGSDKDEPKDKAPSKQ